MWITFCQKHETILGILTGKASVSFLQAFLRCHMCLAKSAQTEKKSASCIRLVLLPSVWIARLENNLQYLVILRQKKITTHMKLSKLSKSRIQTTHISKWFNCESQLTALHLVKSTRNKRRLTSHGSHTLRVRHGQSTPWSTLAVFQRLFQRFQRNHRVFKMGNTLRYPTLPFQQWECGECVGQKNRKMGEINEYLILWFITLGMPYIWTNRQTHVQNCTKAHDCSVFFVWTLWVPGIASILALAASSFATLVKADRGGCAGSGHIDMFP
jgi:hypothetical protein